MESPSWRIEGVVVDGRELRRNSRKSDGPGLYMVRLRTVGVTFEVTTPDRELFGKLEEGECVKMEGVFVLEEKRVRMRLERIISGC